ncbi:MAG: lipopolysaccharide biosynthesis protein [Granulosicoccus sp.]
MGLKTQTVNSTAWVTGGLIANQGINLLRLAVFARILTPEDFGIYAMVMVLFMFLTTAGDLGSSAAIVQREKVSQSLLSTIFYSNLIFGAVLALLLYSVSPFAAAVYGEPKVAAMLALMSIIFVISSGGFVHAALLRKEMEFRKLTISNITANLLSSILSIYLAVKGFGYLSFAIQVLSHAVLFTGFLFIARRWRPGLTFSITDLKSVLGFSANLTAFNFIDYAASNADKFLVGKFLGSSALGAYYLGFRLILMPVKQAVASASSVIFSVLSKLQNQPVQFTEVFLKVVSAVSFLVAPLVFFVFVTSDLLTVVLFGDNWSDASSVIALLAPAALIQSILSPCGLICLVKDRTDILLKLSLLVLAVIPAGVLIGLQWGADGAALAYTLCSFLLAVPSAYYSLRLAGITVRQLLQSINIPVFAAALVALVVGLCREHLVPMMGLNEVFELAFSLLLGASLYLLAMGKTIREEIIFLRERKA